MEEGPRVDSTRNPPSPKFRGTDSYLVPTPTDLKKIECPGRETCVVILKARFDRIEEHLRQQLRWETGVNGFVRTGGKTTELKTVNSSEREEGEDTDGGGAPSISWYAGLSFWARTIRVGHSDQLTLG